MTKQNMRHIGSSLLKAHDRLCDGCARIAAWMMLAMALIITYEVLVRYFFSRPTIWVADFTDYIMLYSTFFVSAWLLKHGGHVSLTILSEHLSPRPRLMMDVINPFIGAVVCGFVIWYGTADCWDAVKNDIFLARPVPVPKYLILAVIPFGSLLLLVQFLKNGFKSLRDLKALAQQRRGATSANEQRR